MTPVSAVSQARVEANNSAATWLNSVARTLQLDANDLDAMAARGSTLFSSADDVAALHVREGLLRAVRELRKSAHMCTRQAEAFAHGPCPACARVQSKHCSGCGACPDMAIIRGAKGHLTVDCPVLQESFGKRLVDH